MKNTTLESIVRWGVYACALIPLIIFKEFLSPFHFGKVVVFRAFIEILAIFYVALILKDRQFLPKPNLLFWVLTIFTAVFGITSLTSINPYQSIMGTLERMGGWFTFLHFWAMYIMAVSVLRTREEWMRFLRISVMANLISVTYAALQKTDWNFIVGSGNRARIFGTLGNTALFAGYTLVNMFFAIILAAEKKAVAAREHLENLALLLPFTILLSISAGSFRGWLGVLALAGLAVAICYLFGWALIKGLGFYPSFSRIAPAIIAVFSFFAIVSTAVRGSLLALLVSIPLFAILYAISGESRKLKIGFLVGAIFFISAQAVLIASHDTSFVKSSVTLSRLSDFSFKTRLVQTRLWAWNAGIDGWNDSGKTLLFGWGPENYNIPFSKHFNPKFYVGIGSETLFDRAHNMFIEVLVTMGLVGIISYLAIFAVLIWLIWKIYKSSSDATLRFQSVILFTGLVAYSIHNALIFDTSANFIVFFIFLGLVNILSSQNSKLASRPPSAFPSSLRYAVILLLSGVVAVSIYSTDIRPIKANYTTTRAVVASWSGEHATAVKKFQEALAYDTFPVYELRHRYAQYALENYGKFSDKGVDPGKTLLDVVDQVKKNLNSQLDYLPYLYISRAYIILGKSDPASPFNDLALENSLKAIEISPTFVRTYYEVAQIYLNKKDYPNAIVAFQKAADLSPEVALSWWYLGVSQIESGDQAGGLISIEKAFKLGYVASEQEILRLISIYEQKKNFQEIAGLYEYLIKMSPNNPQYRASLSATYAKLGRIEDAIREAKKAAEIDPSFEADARTFVRQIGGTW